VAAVTEDKERASTIVALMRATSVELAMIEKEQSDDWTVSRIANSARRLLDDLAWHIPSLRAALPHQGPRTKAVCIYRLWGHNGDLLYIGISNDGLSRVKTHTKEVDWRMQIASISIEDCADTAADARVIEARAIRLERPRYNKVHNQ
jgi:hypothetical protein